MASQSGTSESNIGMGACCLSGKLQKGTPKGVEEQIGGRPCYVSAPEGGSKAKSIVFIVDIFGYALPNVRLLADEYAKKGFYAYVPDVQEGDYLPEDFLQTVEPQLPEREAMSLTEKATSTAKVGTTLGPWLIRRREAVSKPIIDGFIQTIRLTPGTDKLGVIGFCWGGRYAMLAGHETDPNKSVDAVYACHPSLLSIPADIDPIVKPISVAVGSKDSLVDMKQVEQIKDILDKKSEVPHQVKVYEDQVHGFALRGDWSSEKDKKSMDEALNQGIEWFTKYLA